MEVSYSTSAALLSLACVLGMVLVNVTAIHYTIDYRCQPNGDIKVINPDVKIMKSATAGTNFTKFNVTAPADLSFFTIIGCPKNEEILFTVSTRKEPGSMGDGIIAGSYSETYVISCLEIDQDGVLFNISEGMAVIVDVVEYDNSTNFTSHIPWYSEHPVTPTFTIFSSIWNSDQTQQVTEANIGDLLKWKIQGPYEYDLLPYSCTVNPGPVYGVPPLIPVIKDGCSEMDMVSNFVSAGNSSPDTSTMVSDLYAFKFVMSEELTFSCSVKICTKGNATCTASCNRRKRRAQTNMPDDMDGVRANVISHLILKESGAVSQGLSYILLISSFIIGTGLNVL